MKKLSDDLKTGSRVYYVALVELTADASTPSDLMIHRREAAAYPAGTRLYFAKKQPGGKGPWRLTVRGNLAVPLPTERQAKALFEATAVMSKLPGVRPRVLEVREERQVELVYPLSPLEALARVAE